MGKNIDNMTMAEIKSYVEKLERIRKTQASIIAQYRDFMASVERFEIELNRWVEFYHYERDEKLDVWCENTNPELENKLYCEYGNALAAKVVVNIIAEKFNKIIDFDSLAKILDPITH